MSETILILGAGGQIGSELVVRLGKIYGNNHIVASDVRFLESLDQSPFHFEVLDATDKEAIIKVVEKYKVTQIYNLVAMLSAVGEKYPKKAWNLNMQSHLNVLEIAKEKSLKRVFWPSSIAAFGPNTPKENTPQNAYMDPTTVYGISKLSGEFWCNYYHENYGVDVRSIRYPGIISWKTKPGGGTTDYAVEIFFEAIEKQTYSCFLTENTKLPMMYMDDAIDATIQLMQADADDIKIRTSYNLAAINFTPKELAEAIQEIIPSFSITYQEDFRQKIADTWPQSIDDTFAREHWNWQHKFDLKLMTKEMIENLNQQKTEMVDTL